MEMFLMGIALSLFGVAVCAVAFGAATSGVDAARTREAAEAAAKAAAPARFFAARVVPPDRPVVPIEVLLLQIERHVRLEQAAGESFLQAPTRQSLHCRTTSPLMN